MLYPTSYSWQKLELLRHELEQSIFWYGGINKCTPIDENSRINTKPINVALPSFMNMDHTT